MGGSSYDMEGQDMAEIWALGVSGMQGDLGLYDHGE